MDHAQPESHGWLSVGLRPGAAHLAVRSKNPAGHDTAPSAPVASRCHQGAWRYGADDGAKALRILLGLKAEAANDFLRVHVRRAYLGIQLETVRSRDRRR